MLRLKILLQSNYIYIILILISLLIAFFRIYAIGYTSKIDIEKKYFEGIVTNYYCDDKKCTLFLKGIENIIGYYYYKGEPSFILGSKIKVTGKWSVPRNNTIPNNFNYKNYLKNNYIYYLITIEKYELLKENKNPLYTFKMFLLNRISKLTLISNNYVLAFVLGDKRAISEDYKLFNSNGTSHLIAVSGMHINFLAISLLFFFKKIKHKYLIVNFFLICYIFLIGYSASLIRSYVFFLLLLINKKFDFNISTKNILLLTCSILIFYNPLIIFDIGFLYSAIIIYGLISCDKYYRKNILINLLITSTIAFVFSIPITSSISYEINIFSIINNLVFIPLVTYIIFPLSIILIIIPFIEPIYLLFLKLLINLNNTAFLIDIFKIVIPKCNIIIYFIYYLFLVLFIKSNNLKFLIINIILIVFIKLYPAIDNNKYIYFLDVNQGDSALIINNKEVILIDTGGLDNYNISDNTMLLLRSLGKNKIDLLLITHGDYDHMGEAINLINNFKVDKVIFNCGPYNDLENELIKVLDKKKINYYSCIKELNINKNKLYFLQTKEYDNENDNSNVIYTELNGYKFMFMGDASTTTEREIIENYNLPDIDVLKVGHHGSKTSSGKEFIDEINPKYSIIGVGKNNKYGHPNKEVLYNLKDSKIYRTDQDGSVILKIKNNKLKIETCLP